MEKPQAYYDNNVGGTGTLLQTILVTRALPFIFSSSYAIYGLPETLPIGEEHPQRPINPFGQSKLACEWMLADSAKTHGLPYVALRYFNAAGCDPDGEIGETHNPETHLVPLVLMASRDGGAVKIYGADYDTPDGTCVRDYVHVVDIAEAHVRALDYLLKGGGSGAFNLANARGYSVREVIAAAEQVCGSRIRSEIAPRRPDDPPVLIGAAERARKVLGWTPARSALETQIADAWRWLKKA